VTEEARDEARHVADAPEAVAGVGAPSDPGVLDAVDGLDPESAVDWPRLDHPDVREGARHDAHAVAELLPRPGHVVGAVVHPVGGRPGVVVGEENIQWPSGSAETMRSPACPSPWRDAAADTGRPRNDVALATMLLAVGPSENVPAPLDELRPLGLIAQDDAALAEEVGLLL
jgi:hypothetical protein